MREVDDIDNPLDYLRQIVRCVRSTSESTILVRSLARQDAAASVGQLLSAGDGRAQRVYLPPAIGHNRGAEGEKGFAVVVWGFTFSIYVLASRRNL